MIDLTVMSPSIWKRYTSQQTIEKEMYPNKIYYTAKGDYVIEASRSNQGSDFSVCKKAVERGVELLKEGGIKSCNVRFVEPNGDYVSDIPLTLLYKKLRNIAPQNGRFGPFWWITEDFEVAGSCEGVF